MSNIVLVAETGCDIPFETAKQQGIYLVPMHVSFENSTLDDGTFPVENICKYYAEKRKLPKTSGCVPTDFSKVFDEIHSAYPQKHILHLAYSASTTCSYQSAIVAAEDRDYVTSIDTKHVSVGQASIVLQLAQFLKENENATIAQAVEKANELCSCTRMCFIPDDLEYLRAGGRVSNAMCLGGRLLKVHPCIEILDGHLLATKKYRGSMTRIVSRLIHEYALENKLKKDQVWMIWSVGLPNEVRDAAEKAAREYGFVNISWLQTGSVITVHGGPKAFGIVGNASV